ncbi:MAG: hypothetical protein J7J01_02665 [Methanophagales archaeon]|nr:hypothetical protein [Methanophagales archaeon]
MLDDILSKLLPKSVVKILDALDELDERGLLELPDELRRLRARNPPPSEITEPVEERERVSDEVLQAISPSGIYIVFGKYADAILLRLATLASAGKPIYTIKGNFPFPKAEVKVDRIVYLVTEEGEDSAEGKVLLYDAAQPLKKKEREAYAWLFQLLARKDNHIFIKEGRHFVDIADAIFVGEPSLLAEKRKTALQNIFREVKFRFLALPEGERENYVYMITPSLEGMYRIV